MPEKTRWKRARKVQPFDDDSVVVFKRNGTFKVIWWLAIARWLTP